MECEVKCEAELNWVELGRIEWNVVIYDAGQSRMMEIKTQHEKKTKETRRKYEGEQMSEKPR